MTTIDVRRSPHGAWHVYIDGRLISDHATSTGARAAAQNLQRAEVSIDPQPGGAT